MGVVCLSFAQQLSCQGRLLLRLMPKQMFWVYSTVLGAREYANGKLAQSGALALTLLQPDILVHTAGFSVVVEQPHVFDRVNPS